MKKKLLFIATILFCVSAFSQEEKPKHIDLNGYVKYMNTVIFDEYDSPWIVDNLIHNRLNFKLFITEKVTLKADMRNRLAYGDYVKMIPNYDELLSADNGYLNFLTNTIYSNSSSVLTTSFDRLFLEYNKNSWTITAGRQRINWGQSFAWNPNDIFNAYSFFDFDYEERPGSDALRVQYYPNYTSTVDAAVKIDKEKKITAAGLFRFNRWGYDLQFIGGIVDSSDYVVGTGWSGSIKKIGFTGEASYFHSQKNAFDTTGVAIITTGLNYLFSNSLYISLETIYNGYFNRINLNSFTDLYFIPMSVKTISFSKFSWFAQASYPIHPLLNSSLSVMYFPSLGDGCFVMPSIAYSAANNMEISLIGQKFQGKFNGNKENLNMVFIRFKVNF